jgi:hypothetical protein
MIGRNINDSLNEMDDGVLYTVGGMVEVEI